MPNGPGTGPGQKESQLYRGSCHCGAVRYEARINFQGPTPEEPDCIMSRCNCSYCQKAGLLIVSPISGSFRLLPPKGHDDGEPKLVVYRFGAGMVKHYFCPGCGITCHYSGSFKTDEGKVVPFTRLNAQTVDGRVDGTQMESLQDIQIKYWDGKSDGWDKGASTKPYDGGVW